jgi:hypothetical protein
MHEPTRRTVLAAIALASAAAIAGCDCVAQKKLISGQHSEHDVRALMGVPTMVWDRADGVKKWDYVRAARFTFTEDPQEQPGA